MVKELNPNTFCCERCGCDQTFTTRSQRRSDVISAAVDTLWHERQWRRHIVTVNLGELAGEVGITAPRVADVLFVNLLRTADGMALLSTRGLNRYDASVEQAAFNTITEKMDTEQLEPVVGKIGRVLRGKYSWLKK